jgi:hypothetical protein
MFRKDCQSGKKDEVTARLAADFTGWENDNAKFEEQFERVVAALMAGSPLGVSHSQPSEHPKST